MADKVHPPRTVSPPTHTSPRPIFSISSIGIDGRNTSYRAECPKVESVRRRYGRRTHSALGRLHPLTQSKIHLDLGWTQTDCIFLCPVVRGVQQYKIYRPHAVISHKEVIKHTFSTERNWPLKSIVLSNPECSGTRFCLGPTGSIG